MCRSKRVRSSRTSEKTRRPKAVEKAQGGKIKERLSHLDWKTCAFPTASTATGCVYLFPPFP
jgi:hypothetical protein